MRPPDVHSERRLTWALALGLAAYYGLVVGGHHYSIDGILMFQTAKQLLFHGTIFLDPPVKWGLGTVHISKFALGLPLAYLPALALQAPFAAWIPNLTTIPYEANNPYNQALIVNLPYMLASWVNPVISGATGALVFRLARSFALSPRWSVAAALAYGLASPAVGYARYDFAQPLAGLAITGALLLARGAPTPLHLLGVGGSLAAAILTRPEFVILAAWFVIGVGLRTRRLGSIAMVAAPVAVGVAFDLAVNLVKSGSITESGYAPIHTLFAASDVLLGVAGLLVGPSHGLLVFFPLAWLAPLGLARMIQSDGRSGILWTGLLGLGIVFYGAYFCWWGGVVWGPRFLVPLVPLLTMAATYWAATPGRISPEDRRVLFWALFGVGVVISWNAVLLDVVSFNNWLNQRGVVLAWSIDQFQVFASPLVSGWTFIGQSAPDLLWIRNISLGGRAMLASEMAILALVGIVGWSAACVYRSLQVEGEPKRAVSAKAIAPR